MKRPDPKKYFPKDFINGKYEEDLEKYIDYLESLKHALFLIDGNVIAKFPITKNQIQITIDSEYLTKECKCFNKKDNKNHD